jgi:hypothetical protein
MSKKYIGKTCAYCGRERASKTADHILARQFFLLQDRSNLPIVPACERCNSEKSLLEQYALTVLPLGSRQTDAKTYSDENIPRRLKKNVPLQARLSLEHSGLWEQRSDGLLIPIRSVRIDAEKIQELFALVVRGLFMFHWQMPLHSKWYADVAIIRPEAEHYSLGTILYKMGQRVTIKGDLGRGTFVYWSTRSASPRWWSLWQFTLFGGLQFGNPDAPNRSFTKLSAVTRPDMSLAPFTNEEARLSAHELSG